MRRARLLIAARRVRTGGRLGRATAVVMRSVGAVMIGAGGWALGLLVILVAGRELPSTTRSWRRSAPAVVALSVFPGWTSGDRSRAAERRAATVGALAVARLGFHATTSKLALVKAPVAATAYANLAVLALDITVDRGHAQDRPAATKPDERRSGRGRGEP